MNKFYKKPAFTTLGIAILIFLVLYALDSLTPFWGISIFKIFPFFRDTIFHYCKGGIGFFANCGLNKYGWLIVFIIIYFISNIVTLILSKIKKSNNLK